MGVLNMGMMKDTGNFTDPEITVGASFQKSWGNSRTGHVGGVYLRCSDFNRHPHSLFCVTLAEPELEKSDKTLKAHRHSARHS